MKLLLYLDIVRNVQASGSHANFCEKGSEINCSLMDSNPLIGIVVNTSVSGSKGESCPVPCLCKIC